MKKISMLTVLFLTAFCQCISAKENDVRPFIKIPTHQGQSFLTVSCHSVDTDSIERTTNVPQEMVKAETDNVSQEKVKATTETDACIYLSVQEIREDGQVLVLDDGSEWDIKYFSGGWRLIGWGWTEQKTVSHWSVGDKIEIQYPGSSNFIDFVLMVSNVSKNEEACATPRKPPSLNHATCLWVVDIDKETNRMTISNGTVWFKTDSDMYGALFVPKPVSQVTWEPGDALTLVRVGSWINNCYMLWNHSINEMPIGNQIK